MSSSASRTTTTSMAHDLPSPLRQLELHAVDLDDDSDSDIFPPVSPSCASSAATTASSSDRDSKHSGSAHARKKLAAAGEVAKLELGVQERAPREQQQQHLTSDARTFANTIIAFLGSGVLGLPFAFKQTGILLGLATLVFVAALSTYAMLLVVQCKYKLKAQGRHVTTYGEIGFIAMGRTGKLLVDSSLVISQSGFCVAYLIFIASNAHKFLDVSRELVVSVCVPPLLAFSLLKHMRELAYVALFADVMNFSGLAVVLASDLAAMERDHDTIRVVGVLASVPFFFGVASYCFEGVGMVLPLENAIRHKRHFAPILVATVVIITTIYATFGICGYLAFGDATQDVITLNLEGHDGVASVVKLCLCVGLLCTYPVMMFPVFEVLQPLLLRGCSQDTSDLDDLDGLGDHASDSGVSRTQSSARSSGSAQTLSPKDERKVALMRACVVLVTAVIAAGVPNFGKFIAFIGSTCCALLGYVLPTLFYVRIFEADAHSPRVAWPTKLLLYAISLLGVAAFASGVYDAAVSVFG